MTPLSPFHAASYGQPVSLIIPATLCGGAGSRLANPGRIPVEIVTDRAYLEEDDIMRIEDDYGRL